MREVTDTMTEKAPPSSVADKVASFLRSYGGPPEARSPVIFEDLKVKGTGSGVSSYCRLHSCYVRIPPNVSQAAVAPTVLSTVQPLVDVFRSYRKETPHRTLLRSFNGVIKPGEMVLVVGKPGSGCTTFLKTLAGLKGEYHDTQGSLLYGDKPIHDKGQDPVLTTFCRK